MKRVLFILALCALPALAQPAPAEHGKAVYDAHCTACHGADGNAGERAPAIVISGAATALRGERSEAQILDIVRNGIPGTGMPAWKARLPEADILAIGTYVHALRGTALDNPAPGDPLHGQQVFWGKGQCGSCHIINGRGAAIGPDLSNIAVQRKAAAISDALTKVQHRVFGDGGVHLPAIPPMDYQPVTVVTKDGRSISGVMRNMDHWSVQMVGLDGKYHSFDRAGLVRVTIAPGSIMPSDYDKRLGTDELRDLLAFLTRQGVRPIAGRDSE
jgi:putative heme-binding domain-containing protein